MSELSDPLEQELGSLRPLAPSAALRVRVGQALAGAHTGRRVALGWLLAGAAAACVAALLWRARTAPHEPVVVGSRQPDPVVEVRRPEPTIFAYEQALARSIEDFDALLDREASEAGRQSIRAPASRRLGEESISGEE